MSISPSTTTDGPIIPAWSLGDRLRKIRRMLGMSQIELAEQLGTNAKTYAAWELDSTAPRNLVAVARRIEVLSGVPAAWVLGVESRGSSAIGWYSRDRPLRIVENSQVTAPKRTKVGVPDLAQRTPQDEHALYPDVA